MSKKIFLIDNYDSFVYKLGDEFASLGCQVDAYRANLSIAAALNYIAREKPDLLVMSPGPGSPGEATLCMELLAQAPQSLPIFGVCLGHQCMIEYFGGKVVPCGVVSHGKASMITHQQQRLFKNLPNPLQVGRYHSLTGINIPDVLTVDAYCNDLVMAVSHVTRPIYGVQFHPESVLTPNGSSLIENMLDLL